MHGETGNQTGVRAQLFERTFHSAIRLQVAYECRGDSTEVRYTQLVAHIEPLICGALRRCLGVERDATCGELQIFQGELLVGHFRGYLEPSEASTNQAGPGGGACIKTTLQVCGEFG